MTRVQSVCVLASTCTYRTSVVSNSRTHVLTHVVDFLVELTDWSALVVCFVLFTVFYFHFMAVSKRWYSNKRNVL